MGKTHIHKQKLFGGLNFQECKVVWAQNIWVPLPRILKIYIWEFTNYFYQGLAWKYDILKLSEPVSKIKTCVPTNLPLTPRLQLHCDILKPSFKTTQRSEKARVGWLENSIATCILPYVKWLTSASLMHEAGHSKPVLWDNPEGWGGEGEGSRVQDQGTHVHPWLIHVDVA